MVNIRYISLTLPVFAAFLLAGCTTSPFSGRQPAQVEDRSRPVEEPRTKGTGKVKEPEVTTPNDVPVTETPVEEQPVTVPEEKPLPEKTNPAVIALLDNADQYAAAGQNNRAVASLERAIRIDPKNPVLWHKLGYMHLQENNWVQAIAMAKKSNVLAVHDRSLQARNWMIIARARESLGDKVGSQQAMEMVRKLQQ